MQYVFGPRPGLAMATVSLVIASLTIVASTGRDRGSGSVTVDPRDDVVVTTFGQKAIAIATVAGLSLVLLAISLALGSLLLSLVALGFAFLGTVFVHRLLRL